MSARMAGPNTGRMSARMNGGRLGLRTLSEGTITGLYFIYKYRFLTIAQFARAANFSVSHAAEVLRGLDQWGMVSYFGFVPIPGQGKTPKVYFLTRRGWELLRSEHSNFAEQTGQFSEVHKLAAWSPHMYHRLRIIDLMISVECAIRQRPHLLMVRAFLEYRMIKRGAHVARETTDYVGNEEISESKIVPDVVFILENTQTRKRALFFLETDVGTEQIISRPIRAHDSSIHHKLSQYDRYLQSMRYTNTYGAYGEFRSFVLLFVTHAAQRVENIRRALQALPSEFAAFYRFRTFEQAMGDFLGPIWVSRTPADNRLYRLVRDGD